MADVVDALPTLFGFTPAESFVVIVTNGPRNRFGLRLRLDMPDMEGVDEVAGIVAQHLNEKRQDGVVLVALSAQESTADALMVAVVGRVSEDPIVLAVRADDANVWRYDRYGSPDYGAPMYERTQAVSVAVTQAVAEGQQIWSSREALAAMFTPAPVLDGIDIAAETIQSEGTKAVEDLALVATAALEGSGPATVSDDDARTLAIAAQIIPVRDAIWSTITRGTAENDAEVWRLVAVKTAGTGAAGPYAMAAFGYWLAGDGARSVMAVEQGARADARHSMIDLLGTVVSLGPQDVEGLHGLTHRGGRCQDRSGRHAALGASWETPTASQPRRWTEALAEQEAGANRVQGGGPAYGGTG